MVDVTLRHKLRVRADKWGLLILQVGYIDSSILLPYEARNYTSDRYVSYRDARIEDITRLSIENIDVTT
jgi:hypothetical protein